MKITIFTPTYNRAKLLKRLYESLIQQTNKNFIWLIVDDGSTDNTEQQVNEWLKEEEIKIEYHKQQNSGKSMAHNWGVELTSTELFTCVDSDDYLENNAVEEVVNFWEHSKKNYTGILCFRKELGSKNMNPQKKFIRKNVECTKLRDAYEKHSLYGDTMLIFKTDILKKYKFPVFQGESFVPEAYLYDLVDQEGELLVLNKYLYNCEYQESGYTNNMSKLLKSNPKGYCSYINQRLKFDRKFVYRFKDSIRYIAIRLTYDKKGIIREAVYSKIALLAYPFGYLLYLKKYR